MKKLCSCGRHLASHEATFEILNNKTCIPADFNCPSGGDQLTIVRFTYGRKLPAGGHTSKDRLEHCQPFVTELLHTKQALLTVITTIQHVLYIWWLEDLLTIIWILILYSFSVQQLLPNLKYKLNLVNSAHDTLDQKSMKICIQARADSWIP